MPGPPGAWPDPGFRAELEAASLSGMLSGSVIHHFLVTGLSAMVFIILMKVLVAPHLPAGAQKLILSA